MSLSTDKLQDIFIAQTHYIKSDVFFRLVDMANQTQQSLEQLLLEQSMLTTSSYLTLLSNYFKVPYTELNLSDIDTEVLSTIPKEFATQHMVFPFAVVNQAICVAVIDPSNQDEINLVKQTVGGEIKLYVTTENIIKRALVLYDGELTTRIKQVAEQVASTDPNSQDTSAHKSLMESIFEAAILMGASDIHLENYQSEYLVRFRVDGILKVIANLPKKIATSVVDYVKVASQLKIDEQFVPQDGRLNLDIKGQPVNVRVSVMPALWGEKIVMRVLLRDAMMFNLADLGLLGADLSVIKDNLSKPHGMILVTGPTNSGKSTSMYAFLQEIALERSDSINISTLEDPIEYSLPGVTQTQINDNLTFAGGLRSLLRQDPDILMVGEVRDQETAEFSIRAALVGRLLISSIHTNDATSTPTRLLDLGIEPYLIASTLSLIIAQRLARKLCENCKQAYTPDDNTLGKLTKDHNLQEAIEKLMNLKVIESVDTSNIQLYKSSGCEKCNKTGYQGRIGLFEVFQLTKPISDAILNKPDSEELRKLAIENGMKTMFEDGLAKLLLGKIDLDELFLATYA